VIILEISKEIQHLKKLEDRAIFYALAMRVYNPSIGRVFKKSRVNQFISISLKAISKVQDVHSFKEFDLWHKKLAWKETTITRIGAKIIAYLIRIYIRTIFIIIFRRYVEVLF
jgi:hypothetical protein